MADEVTARHATWLADAAERLGARLRAGGLPREARKQGRALLQRAFDALAAAEAADGAEGTVEPNATGGEGGESTDALRPPPIALALIRDVDAAGTPLVPTIPRPPRIGVPPLRTHPDPAWIDRLFAAEDLADAVMNRTERVLAALRDPTVRQALGRFVTGSGGDVDLTLTQG